MAGAGLKQTGIKELSQFFIELPDNMKRKHIRKASAKAGRALAKEQKKRVPRSKSTGSTDLQSKATTQRLADRKDLFKSIIVRPSSQWPSKKSVAAAGIIGVSVGPRWPEGAVTHLVEFGHNLTAWGHKTSVRIPPQPFMRPAQRAARPQIKSIYETALRAGLRKEAAKAGIRVT